MQIIRVGKWFENVCIFSYTYSFISRTFHSVWVNLVDGVDMVLDQVYANESYDSK